MCGEWWNMRPGQENESSWTPRESDPHFFVGYCKHTQTLVGNKRNEVSFFSHERNLPTVSLQ